MEDVTAVILGGGRGTRLYPLTLERAKPAVGFAGKYRLIDVPISNCINSDIRRIYVLTQFLSASLHRHIMQTYQFDTFTDGFVEILAAEQTHRGEAWYQGTADAVRASLRNVNYYRSDAILILSGDQLYRMDYKDFVSYHRDSKADITIAAYPVTREDAPRMGLLKADAKGRIVEFAEKPKDPKVIEKFRAPKDLLARCGLSENEPRYLGSMGIYVFDPVVLAESLSDTGQIDFGKEVIPSSISKCKVMAYPFNGYWEDIGTIKSFYEANIAMAKPNPAFPLYLPGQPIYTRQRNLPPSRIERSEISESLVVEGCDINGAKIKDSVVGLRSVIGEGTELNGVVMMGADYYEGEKFLQTWESAHKDAPRLGIGKNCRIERAIIDKNARIGDSVTITAKPEDTEVEGQNFWVRDGIVVIPRNGVIKPGTKI
jgi:glucose-1-phosphate adenylyltransferase